MAFGNVKHTFLPVRRQHEFLALAVIIALRPAVIGALSEDYHCLRWEFETLLGGAQMWPTFNQLIAAATGRRDYG